MEAVYLCSANGGAPFLRPDDMRGKPRIVSAAISTALLACLVVAYWLKPDFAAAVTIFPFWSWTWLGLLLLIGKGRWRLAIAGLWLLATFAFSEEWIGFIPRKAPTEGPTITIVSLNCAGGTIAAAEEVAKFHPDIVLLQESPGRDELRKLAASMFGKQAGLATGPDGAILCRWPLTLWRKPHIDCTMAIAHPPKGPAVNIVSLRLMPPAFRIDLVSPSAWAQVAENRGSRREELREVADVIRSMPVGPTIAGGDFNAQSGDAVFREMPPFLKDAFYRGARGWCHTAVNEYPLARIDQIWLSPDLSPVELRAHQTQNSDHRMVVLRATWPGQNK